MKSNMGLALVALILAVGLRGATEAPYRTALPGFRYEFPRDHFSHPDFQTEWWYYTGNLRTSEGRRFGFELTFFRQGVERSEKPGSVWDVKDIWMAHLALSDIDGGRFLHAERLNRAGTGIAGADFQSASVWNGNWRAAWLLDSTAPGGVRSQELRAVADQFSFELSLTPEKAPIIHGRNGVSQKADGPGRASHYISFTRLATKGAIVVEGKRFEATGLTWMDHEFFTHQLETNQTGWDWFSLQLEDRSEIMLFQLRRKDGTIDPYSAGTYIDPQGRAMQLTAKDFAAAPGKTWTSPDSGGRYPIQWTIQIPSLGVQLDLSTRLAQQELKSNKRGSPPYWEGAIEVSGKKGNAPVKGQGYLEMTGYAAGYDFSLLSK